MAAGHNDVVLEPTCPVAVAAHRGDLPKLAALLYASPSLVTDQDRVGRTPLHWAVAGEQALVVK